MENVLVILLCIFPILRALTIKVTALIHDKHYMALGKQQILIEKK